MAEKKTKRVRKPEADRDAPVRLRKPSRKVAEQADSKSHKAPLEPAPAAGDVKFPTEVAVLPSAGYALYPSMIAPFVVQDPANVRMVDEVVRGDRLLGVFAIRPESLLAATEGEGPPSFKDIYPVGSLAAILQLVKTPEGAVRLLLQGIRRVRITHSLSTTPVLRAAIEPIPLSKPDDAETRALKRTAVNLLRKLIELGSLNEDLLVAANNTRHPGKLADLIAANLSLNLKDQQELLEIEDPKMRLLRLQEFMAREIEIVKIGQKIQTRVSDKMEKTQREFYLREQLQAIRSELGEGEEGETEIDLLRKQIKKARLPEHALKVAERELNRLDVLPTASPEYSVSRTYLGWILALPWNERTTDNIDLKHAQEILDADHYDLNKVKEKILEYLAVIKLRKKIKGPILCMVGPPGVGKTSLGRSIARAMNRKFARIALGGMHDEGEIRGHRRTYIGAMPGRILSALKECGTVNPVIMLDEIDKMAEGFHGDPAAALLETLDPEQNASFNDNYLDIPYDLSNVLFITTANMLDTIPSALLDRMEIIELSGYTVNEKIQISQRYLVPKAVENSGVPKDAITFTPEGLQTIIELYTREAGLRNLEREINNICRKTARRIAEGEKVRVSADPAHVKIVFGPPRFSIDESTHRANMPGVAVGLAWTWAGGDILFIEATATAGEGRLMLTGQLGDVMKESAMAAYTFLQANADRIGAPLRMFRQRNIHVHVPEGATPKDGPSAGVAIMLAMASLLKNQPIRERLAMTGEITLKGNVLPVGGVKEKILAAHRSGIQTVIMPKENERDLENVPPEVREALEFKLIDRAEEALEIAFPRRPRAVGVKARKTTPLRKPAPGPRKRPVAPATSRIPIGRTTDRRRAGSRRKG